MASSTLTGLKTTNQMLTTNRVPLRRVAFQRSINMGRQQFVHRRFVYGSIKHGTPFVLGNVKFRRNKVFRRFVFALVCRRRFLKTDSRDIFPSFVVVWKDALLARKGLPETTLNLLSTSTSSTPYIYRRHQGVNFVVL